MQKISARQRSIVEFIARHTRESGFPPTIREIGEAVGLRSTCSVFRHLQTLERLGYIRKQYFGNRAIEILRGTDYSTEPRRTVNVPLLREPCPRELLLSRNNIAEVYAFSRNLLPENNCFMFTMQDENMAHLGIARGDMVVVHPETTLQEGEVVAACEKDRFVVSLFSEKNLFEKPQDQRETVMRDRVTGKQTEASLPSPPTPSGDVLGKVVMVIRRLREATATGD